MFKSLDEGIVSNSTEEMFAKKNYIKICFEIHIDGISAELNFPDKEINPSLKFVLDEPESEKKSTKTIKETSKPSWKEFFNL
jgi:hypothetical protein